MSSGMPVAVVDTHRAEVILAVRLPRVIQGALRRPRIHLLRAAS
jgi:hypothetical protein